MSYQLTSSVEKMNILPHKSWHVRTKRNIEKVRRDEAKARREEEELERRREVAENEARIDFLRKRSRSKRKHGDEEPEASTSSSKSEGALNSAAEAKIKRERELLEKRKREEWEKKVGILTYLGQGLSGPDVKNSWYLQDHQKRAKIAADIPASSITRRGDPMFEMERVQRLMKQSKQKSCTSSSHVK